MRVMGRKTKLPRNVGKDSEKKRKTRGRKEKGGHVRAALKKNIYRENRLGHKQSVKKSSGR